MPPPPTPKGRTIALTNAGGRLTPVEEDRARREGHDRGRHPPAGLERLAAGQDRRGSSSRSPRPLPGSTSAVGHPTGGRAVPVTSANRSPASPTPATRPAAPDVARRSREGQAGTVEVAAAARSWERIGPAVTVHWFPPSKRPVALVGPAPRGSSIPATSCASRSRSPSEGARQPAPKLSPRSPATERSNDHTLVFTPTGFGAGLGTHRQATLPPPSPARRAVVRRPTREIEWTVPAGSPLRLNQLLAEGGYLPVEFKPTGAPWRTPARSSRPPAPPPRAASSGARTTRRRSSRTVEAREPERDRRAAR